METIGDVGEFGLIRRISHDFLYRPELVKLGSGDDCAVYDIPPGYDELISTDTMVEGIHFTNETMGPEDVGWKLCASNFSDTCAMGGEPVGFVISAAFPGELPVSWVERCYDGIRACCETYHVNLLGGDVTGTPKGIILTGTVTGMVPKNGAITRGGAQAGDIVVATGNLGDSAAGLAAILFGEADSFPSLVRAHRRPQPQVKLAAVLRKAGATALNDISDGLSREANEIARASGVTMEIEEDAVPLSSEARGLAQKLHKNPLLWALNGGEDYQLVGTIPQAGYERVRNVPGITCIGRVTEQSEGKVFLAGRSGKQLLQPLGFDHFAKENTD